jgi:hypothetical protein
MQDQIIRLDPANKHLPLKGISEFDFRQTYRINWGNATQYVCNVRSH